MNHPEPAEGGPVTTTTGDRLAALATRSTEIISDHQHPGGAYLAAPTFPVYRYSWLRDGAFIADAMSRAGRTGSADRFLGWCRQVVQARADRITALVARQQAGQPVADAELLPTRYTVEGQEADHDWPNFQLDGYGAWLWALGAHAERSAVDGDRYAPAVAATARYLTAFWQRPCFDCWEENGDRIHTATLAAVHAGLQVAAGWPAVPAPVRDRARAAATEISGLVRSRCTRDGHLVKWLDGDQLDASLLFCAVPYRLFRPDDPLMRTTVAALAPELAHGGVHRHRADVFYGGGEWVLLAAVLGSYHAVTGDLPAASAQLAWVARQADADGQLPEQIHDHLLHPAGLPEWQRRWGPVARPLLWSHAMYLNLYQEVSHWPEHRHR